LQEWAVAEFPALNVLVNNAGIQRRVRLAEGEDWGGTRREIAINFDAPVHLTTLFLPRLLKQTNAAVVNVTSGLAFSPLARVPVYCATKAALRSFTLSLRRQLSATSIKVVEIIPPAVNTDLGGPGLHTFGVPLDEFADSVFERLAGGELEIAYGTAETASRASREQLDAIFERMNAEHAPGPIR
ncbi:MAG: SDR family NAD(P)-dependent oxidoreductase, partial [Acidobacteriota bacterium]|nr:SDR family NAD(P)-dependent oxidoreductase [Acidobacteriota bacterium]